MTKLKVPEHIKNLIPYPPGKPMEELKRELGVEHIIKLASNENPIGASPKAIDKIKKAINGVNRYPDGSGYYLKEKLSKKLSVEHNNIILGNGSNEIIELVFRTFFEKGDNIVSSETTFAVYPIICQGVGGEYRKAPMKNLHFDLDAIEKLIDNKTKIIFIANPNNPTGTYINKDKLTKFMDNIRDDILVVLDEAYFEFVNKPDYPDGLELFKKYNNLLILRTFSKIYGLAGLRLGYGIGNTDVIDYLNRVRQPFNVNLLAQEAALGALEDDEFVEKTQNLTYSSFDYLYGELDKMGLEYVPSVTNFFLIKVGKGKEVFQELLKKGTIVRPMDGYKMPEYIRINIGTQEENKKFINDLKEVITF